VIGEQIEFRQLLLKCGELRVVPLKIGEALP